MILRQFDIVVIIFRKSCFFLTFLFLKPFPKFTLISNLGDPPVHHTVHLSSYESPHLSKELLAVDTEDIVSSSVDVFVSVGLCWSFDKNRVETRARVKQTAKVPTFNLLRRSLGIAAILNFNVWGRTGNDIHQRYGALGSIGEPGCNGKNN